MIPFAAAGAFLGRIPAWVWVALALLAGGWYYGHTRFEDGQADIQAKWNKANSKQEAINRAKEAVWRKSVYDLAYKAETQRLEVKNENDAAITGLRDGSIRVRDRFKCPVSGNPPASGQSDSSPAGFQPEDAVAALGITAEADDTAIKLNQCIASYNALRK